MPKWALERSAEVGAATAGAAISLGVRVVGDIFTLAETPDQVAGDDELTATPELPWRRCGTRRTWRDRGERLGERDLAAVVPRDRHAGCG
jgi:hypothetical protein